MNIATTAAEREAGKFTDDKLGQAVAEFRRDGYLVLDQVVEHEHLDVLRQRMDLDSQKLIEADKWGGAGRVQGHLQQGPPPFPPFVFADVAANSFAVQISQAILGEGLFCSFYNGNTNTPGSCGSTRSRPIRRPRSRSISRRWKSRKKTAPLNCGRARISKRGLSAIRYRRSGGKRRRRCAVAPRRGVCCCAICGSGIGVCPIIRTSFVI